MTTIQRVSLSTAGSVLTSVVASWALRRLLLAAEQGSDEQRGKQSAVVVVIPIIIGNTAGFRPPRGWRTPPPVQPV